jgi:hypothetical protein
LTTFKRGFCAHVYLEYINREGKRTQDVDGQDEGDVRIQNGTQRKGKRKALLYKRSSSGRRFKAGDVEEVTQHLKDSFSFLSRDEVLFVVREGCWIPV